jgi:hypothetical protein
VTPGRWASERTTSPAGSAARHLRARVTMYNAAREWFTGGVIGFSNGSAKCSVSDGCVETTI